MKKPTTLSYATWNPDDIRDLSFPQNFRPQNSGWVIVGLNPSKAVSFPENFHIGSFDKWHSVAFKHNELAGAPMLDLIDEVDPNSRNVTQKWKNNSNWKEKQIQRFIAEMGLLLKNDKPKLMCIGINTFDLFRKETKITSLFSQLHVVPNPNGIRVKGAQKKYVEMVNECANSSCLCANRYTKQICR
jgi:hypothetical protein